MAESKLKIETLNQKVSVIPFLLYNHSTVTLAFPCYKCNYNNTRLYHMCMQATTAEATGHLYPGLTQEGQFLNSIIVISKLYYRMLS